eukprot:9237405-Prorocentrum_lima.AAC.1
MEEAGTNKTWKGKSRMVVCGIFATESGTLCSSTSAQNVDLGLLRMMLSITSEKNEAVTTTDIANAFLN